MAFKMYSFPEYSSVAGWWLRCLHSINGCGDHVPDSLYVCMCKEWTENFKYQLGKTAKIQLKVHPEWVQCTERATIW